MSESQELTFSGWDKGLDFDKERQKLEALIETTPLERKIDKIRVAYYCMLLVQIVNGARIGEAVKAVQLWSDNEKREQRVRVEKRKDKVMRLMVIPDVILRKKDGAKLRRRIKKMSQYADLTDACIKFCPRHMDYNSHAQRYAFITKRSEEMPVQAIAALTGHKTLNHILHYTSARPAEAKLREWVK